MDSLYLFGIKMRLGREAPKNPVVDTGAFFPASSWQEAESKLAALCEKSDWFIAAEFNRALVEREAIPSYIDYYTHFYDRALEGETLGFFLHHDSNLFRYQKGNAALAAWNGEVCVLGFEARPAPKRDNSDGALGVVATAYVRAGSWPEAQQACKQWAQDHHWYKLKFNKKMRQVCVLANHAMISDELAAIYDQKSQAPYMFQAEWEGICVVEQIWDEE